LTVNISAGTLIGVGQICFYGHREVNLLFAQGWRTLNLQHLDIVEVLQPEYTVHAEWRVIAEKLAEFV
jgi:hypothetical protein